jgi:hypothetical protein
MKTRRFANSNANKSYVFAAKAIVTAICTHVEFSSAGANPTTFEFTATTLALKKARALFKVE